MLNKIRDGVYGRKQRNDFIFLSFSVGRIYFVVRMTAHVIVNWQYYEFSFVS